MCFGDRRELLDVDLLAHVHSNEVVFVKHFCCCPKLQNLCEGTSVNYSPGLQSGEMWWTGSVTR